MSKIILENVSLNYPILGEATRSFKRDIIHALRLQLKENRRKAITQVQALKNVSFKLQDGDQVGLIGHNGAGKSTLLKVLSGIYDVSQGQLMVDGSVSSVLSSNSLGMQPELNAYENIKISALIMGYSKAQLEAMVADIEEFTELGEFLNLPIKTYSSGMQARLAFAISTAVHPDILLLDEVVGTGDAKFIIKARERIYNLVQKAKIFVLASHSNEIIEKFCNKVLWLNRGEIVEFGPTDEVLSHYMDTMAVSD